MKGSFWACAASSILVVSGALAAPPSPPKSSKPPAAASGKSAAALPTLPAGTLDKLKSTDPAQIKSALDDVRTAGKGGAAAAPLIAALLDRGLTVALAQAALETSSDLESELASPSIVPYAQHRNVAVRRAAVKALVHTKGPLAIKALRRALSDDDAMVRGVAASGLGTLKAKDAVPDLFTALDHKIPESAAALGQLCAPDQCDQLASRLGREPFDVVSGGLEQVLFRPTTEIGDDTKVKIVERVRELRTKEANKFLADVRSRWPANGSARVRQALDQGVQATAGSTS